MVCHFKIMEYCFSDYEEWFECKFCGHTVPIYKYEGDR